MTNDLRVILEQMANGIIPKAIPSDLPCAEDLTRLSEYLEKIEQFSLAVSIGDLTVSLKGFNGPVMGSLKSLQANLRHLTWQTHQVAAGDLEQRVDFMGDFSTSFNAMVISLSKTRAKVEAMHARLRNELDIQKELTNKLREEKERLRLITENANAVIWTADVNTGYFTYIGPYVTELRGLTVEEALSETLEESLTPASWERVQAILSQKHEEFLESGDVSIFYDCIEVEQACKDGYVIPVEMIISAIVGDDGKLKEYVGISRDITERKRMEDRLTYLSSHDSLTGLYNRTFFETALQVSIIKKRFPLSVISADLDGVKKINDTMGHAEGDKLLKNATAVFRMLFRNDDIVARVGGDEFMVLLVNTGEDDAAGVIERIRSCEEKFNLEHEGPLVEISLGTATAQNSEEVKHMLLLADSRMYEDKLGRKQQSE